MLLYICKECPYNRTCDKAFKVLIDWFCDNPAPYIKEEQEARFEKDHHNDFDTWIPM